MSKTYSNLAHAGNVLIVAIVARAEEQVTLWLE
jgi:hypothetical protein